MQILQFVGVVFHILRSKKQLSLRPCRLSETDELVPLKVALSIQFLVYVSWVHSIIRRFLVSLEDKHGILELSPDSSGILLHTWAWSPWSLAIVASVAAQAALAAWVSSAPSPDHRPRLHPSSKSFKPHPDWKKETVQNTHVSCSLQTSFEVLATSKFTVCHGNLI